MAFIKLNRKKLKKNFLFLDQLMKMNGREWSVVSKLLCGNELYLREIIHLGVREICDSRISNLKVVKSIDPNVQTVYIKPPARRSIRDVIRYADVSFNSEFDTIKWLSDEAVKQKKKHKIIIMIELGDLREGVMGHELVDFYASVFKLPNIEVTGIGSNLNCLNGVLPSEDKMIILSLYKQLIETKYNVKIPWVTGGTSAMVPMLIRHQVPSSINHFRIGECLFFGNDLITGEKMDGMDDDVLMLYAEIIEITKKPKIPIGQLDVNPNGDLFEIEEEDYGKKSYRAIVDVGLLDISTNFMIPVDPKVSISGASSDMLILDLGERTRYKVGDLMAFQLRYMGALRLLSSDYVGKELE